MRREREESGKALKAGTPSDGPTQDSPVAYLLSTSHVHGPVWPAEHRNSGLEVEGSGSVVSTESAGPFEFISWLGSVTTGAYYRRASALHHNVVKFLPTSSLPYIPGSDGKLVFLFQFVQEWEEATDYEALLSNLPELSSGQVAGAMAFLRSIAQFNTRGVDLDELETATIEAGAEFQESIRESLMDDELPHVLTQL